MNLKIKLAILALLGLILVACTRSCVPNVPDLRDSDAGNYSFVRQAVPKITGRKAQGYNEVKVLSDLITASDRQTVLKALFHQQNTQREFVDHWSENIVDFMRAHRESGKVITGTGRCFGNALRSSEYAKQLAEFVRDNGPVTTSPGAAFNLSDVLRSSLVLDDLSPSYRAYLFAMVKHPITGAETTEQNRRDDLGASFTAIYSHRQVGCLRCHNTISSTTAEHTFWNRHMPIRGRFEHAIYGNNTGRPSDEVHAMLRTDVTGSIAPWGINNSCGTFKPEASVTTDPLTSPGGGPINAYFVQSRGNTGSVWQLEKALDTGVKNIASNGFRRGRDPAAAGGQCSYCSSGATCPSGNGTPVPSLTPTQIAQRDAARTVLNNRGCFGCHSGGAGGLTMSSTTFADQTVGKSSNNNSAKLLVWPGDISRSYLYEKVSHSGTSLPDGSSRMPPPPRTALNATELATMADWINGLAPAAGCTSCPSSGCETDYVDGNDAFAFLTAGRVVENTWSEMFGAPLTIPNYFPRNYDQRNILWNMTELHFVRAHWSMEGLLTRMMTSEFFNRMSPSNSTGPSAYELPPYNDPWVVADPRLPPVAQPGTPPGSGLPPVADAAYDKDDEANRPRHYNSMTDGVHRYSPRSLLYSVHKTLGWPSPKREASGSYPNDNLRKSIGQFYRDAEPGFREIGFQGLLNWEGVHGTCDKPSGFSGNDWIDKLAQEITVFNTSNSSNPVKIRDLVIAIKDRILVDPSIIGPTPTDVTASETDSLQSLFGVALNSTADVSTPTTIDALKEKMRNYCGVLLQTPQFMLAGIAPTQLGEKPRLQVCLDGENCGYRAVCNSYRDVFVSLGKNLVCTDNSVALSDITIRTDFSSLCRRGFCAVLPIKLNHGSMCLRNPRMCLPKPPPCDPRCERIDCCGGPLPSLDREEMFLIWADGGNVKQSSSVRLLRQDSDDFVALTEGMRLQTGDILIFDSKSSINVDTPEGGFKSPKNGFISHDNKEALWIAQITGPQAIKPEIRDFKVDKVDMATALYETNSAYWTQSGEAGSPTIPGQTKDVVDRPGSAKKTAKTPVVPGFYLDEKSSPDVNNPPKKRE